MAPVGAISRMVPITTPFTVSTPAGLIDTTTLHASGAGAIEHQESEHVVWEPISGHTRGVHHDRARVHRDGGAKAPGGRKQSCLT